MMNPITAKDIATIEIPVSKLTNLVEQFTIDVDQADAGVIVVMSWENSRWIIQVDPA